MISGANYLATLDHFDDIQNNHSEIVANYLATAVRWHVGLTLVSSLINGIEASRNHTTCILS